MELNSFEKFCLQAFRNGWVPKSENPKDMFAWARFGLWSLLEIGKMLRSQRITPEEVQHRLKDDNSPLTVLDQKVEDFMRENLLLFSNEATFIGEESGGEWADFGVSIALDPIDGTWSFITHTETCATSLAFFRDGLPFIGMVMNPATGEIERIVLNGPDGHEVVGDDGSQLSPLLGSKVPYWNDIRTQVIKAATVFYPVRTQSWDVAISSDGPVLMEFNFGGDLNLHQIAHGRGALNPEFVAHLKDCGYKGKLP